MKKKFLLTTLLIVMLVIQSVAVVSNAETTNPVKADTKGSITGSGMENGVKVNIYKLVDVNYDANVSSYVEPSYEWISDTMKSCVRKAHQDETQDYLPAAFAADVTANKVDAADFYDRLAVAVIDAKITPTKTVTTADNGFTASGLEFGTYLIIAKNGMKVYRPMVVNLVPTYNTTTNSYELVDVAITEKSSELDITLKVRSHSTDSYVDEDAVSIIDTISYEAQADVPQYPASQKATNYSVSVKLPSGQTNPANIIVYGVKGSTKTELTNTTENTYYTIGTARPNGLGDAELAINFVYNNIKGYDDVIVDFDVTTSSLVEGTTGNTATAYLDYNNNSYDNTSYKTDSDTAVVYTYGIQITKVDSADTSVKLAGAQFNVYTGTSDAAANILYFKGTTGNYTLCNSTTEGAITNVVSDANGLIVLHGLDNIDYAIEEYKAPANYMLSTTINLVTITDTKDIAHSDNSIDGGIEVTDDKTTTNVDTGIYPITIANVHGYSLPITGGIGQVIYIVAGILLISCGVVLVVKSSKKK